MRNAQLIPKCNFQMPNRSINIRNPTDALIVIRHLPIYNCSWPFYYTWNLETIIMICASQI